MTLDLSEYLDLLDDNPLEETPVDIDTFINGEDYLNEKDFVLSDEQRRALLASTQIYRKETLYRFLPPQEAEDRWKQTCNEVILMWGKGCHAPYTPVYNALTGRWQELHEFREHDNTVVGYTDGELTHEYATESFIEGYGRMLRFKTRLGLEEDVYEGHKYYAWENKSFYRRNKNHNNGPAWVEAKDLTTNHKIAVAAGFDVVDPLDIPVEHARFLGYVIGDGCCPSDEYGRLNVDFGSHEVESMEIYKNAVAAIGEDIVFVKHPKKNMCYVSHSRGGKPYQLIRDYGLWGSRANDKFIPDAVWRSSNDVLREFMSALWATDGTVYMKKTNSSVAPTAEYCTISERLAHDVQRALLRLGVPAGLRSRIPTYHYKGERKDGQRAYYITVNGSVSFSRFAEALSLYDTKRAAVAKGLELIAEGQYRQNMFHENLYWDNITSIEDIGDGEYWTMTQPESSNYVGNGFLSHQSGKDELSAISACYVIYLLLCLKNPAKYYGKPDGDPIDIINIAINATQAMNVYFKKVAKYIKKSPWFEGKYATKPGSKDPAQAGQFSFIKEISLYAGHSEREAWEGYNTFLVVLDEISGFALESSSPNGKSASDIYDMYRASVSSRFAEFGKVLLLSFPRFKGDFISQHYEATVKTKQTRMRKYTFKIDPDLPDGIEGNHFTIEWEEDYDLGYHLPKRYASRRPTWEVNPTKTIDEFMPDFFTNRPDALGRLACMPADAIDAFFKDKEKIEGAFIMENGVDAEGRFKEWLQPETDKEYFLHVDLALKHDNCAVAMAHVDRWQKNRFHGMLSDEVPVVYVDVVRWWTPGADRDVDFTEVKEYIASLQKRGFNIKFVSFDQWNSEGVRAYLEERGIETRKLSVGKAHYQDMAMAIGENRVVGPNIDLLKKELLQLRITNDNKVDHPRSGSSDLADATCGAIYNAIANAVKPGNATIEIQTFQSTREVPNRLPDQERRDAIERPTREEMPTDLSAFLEAMQLL